MGSHTKSYLTKEKRNAAGLRKWTNGVFLRNHLGNRSILGSYTKAPHFWQYSLA